MCFYYLYCDLTLLALSIMFLLTTLAFSDPPGTNFIRATCDLTLLALSIIIARAIIIEERISRLLQRVCSLSGALFRRWIC